MPSKSGFWFKFKVSNPKYFAMVGIQTTGSDKWTTITYLNQYFEV